MINDLDETLKQLLVKKAGLDPSEVDISFDIPTREWSTPVTRPTVNLYLYDLRENRQLRETYWDDEVGEDGRINMKRRPLRIDLSYMITCWTSSAEDQHRLLWRVVETFFRHSPIPDDVTFVRALQEYQVLVVPGRGFSLPGYFRIAYCVDTPVIERSFTGFERVFRRFGR